MFETSLDPAQHHENLTIFPILTEADRELSFLLMAEAVVAELLTIGEKDGGQVPFLLATNAGKESVLILDGEQLIGARQNRMTNRSILLPPESITEIPVSCMEQGRWHFVGDHFAPAPQNAPSKIRRKAREIEAAASYRADRLGPAPAPVTGTWRQPRGRSGMRSASSRTSSGGPRTREPWTPWAPPTSMPRCIRGC